MHGHRTALFHYAYATTGDFTQSQVENQVYTLGKHSYFGESTCEMPNWGERYWGDNYAKLKQVKQKWDPHHAFGCHHCVGDSEK